MREPLQDLGCRLDGVAIVQLAGPQGLAKRPPGHVLVGDVDMAGVARERVRTQAALVPEGRRSARLALRPRAAVSLARDDLEGDVEARALVACQPDGAAPAA